MDSPAGKALLSVVLGACLIASACTDSTTAATTTTATLASVTLSSSSVAGGTTVTATATLTSAAPSGGATITLASNSSAATVPASVVIAAGSTSVNFAVNTTATAATAVITATYASSSTTATLTITVSGIAALQALTLATDVTGVGAAVQGTVALSAPAPTGGIAVALSSSNSQIVVPSTVTVPRGVTSATFQIDTSAASPNATATIVATYAGVSQRATLTVGSVALWLGGTTPVPGGTSVVGTVTLAAPAPDGGAIVSLSSSGPVVVVPPSVAVPAGATTQTFPIATVDAPPTQTATVTATYGGAAQSAMLTVWAYPMVSPVRCSPATPSGGASVQCTGSVSPASSSGWTLALSSDNAAATVPSTVAVAAGATDFQFVVTTTSVTAATTATIQIGDAATGLVVWRMLLSISP